MQGTLVDRRGFLVGAGAVSAAMIAATAGFARAEEAPAEEAADAPAEVAGDAAATEAEPVADWHVAPEDPAEASETYDCDVLVIGLGHAGSCALRAAAEAGASVAAFEASTEDGHMVMGGGQVGHINSQFLKDRGVPEVDVVEFMNDWQVRSNPGLVMNYATHCGECFDWLFDQVSDEEKAATQIRCLEEGSEGPFMKELSGLKSWIGTAMTGSYIGAALDHCVEVATQAGGKIFWGTKGYKLIQDESGAVTGAWGQTENGFVQVNAKAVILATGGYGANEAMRNDLLWEINQLQEPGKTSSCMMDQEVRASPLATGREGASTRAPERWTAPTGIRATRLPTCSVPLRPCGSTPMASATPTRVSAPPSSWPCPAPSSPLVTSAPCSMTTSSRCCRRSPMATWRSTW